MPNRREVGLNGGRSCKILQNLINGGGGGLEDSRKFNSQVGVEKILFEMLNSNTKKLKCFGFLSPFKNNKFLIKCILLDINIK